MLAIVASLLAIRRADGGSFFIVPDFFVDTPQFSSGYRGANSALLAAKQEQQQTAAIAHLLGPVRDRGPRHVFRWRAMAAGHGMRMDIRRTRDAGVGESRSLSQARAAPGKAASAISAATMILFVCMPVLPCVFNDWMLIENTRSRRVSAHMRRSMCLREPSVGF